MIARSVFSSVRKETIVFIKEASKESDIITEFDGFLMCVSILQIYTQNH